MHVLSLKSQANADEKLSLARSLSAAESPYLLSIMLNFFALPCCRTWQGCLIFESSLWTQ